MRGASAAVQDPEAVPSHPPPSQRGGGIHPFSHGQRQSGLSVITGLYDQIRQYFISVFIVREPGTRGTAGSWSVLSAAGSQQLCPKPGCGLMKMAACHLSDGHQYTWGGGSNLDTTSRASTDSQLGYCLTLLEAGVALQGGFLLPHPPAFTTSRLLPGR